MLQRLALRVPSRAVLKQVVSCAKPEPDWGILTQVLRTGEHTRHALGSSSCPKSLPAAWRKKFRTTRVSVVTLTPPGAGNISYQSPRPPKSPPELLLASGGFAGWLSP